MLDLLAPMSLVLLSWALFMLLFSGLGITVFRLLEKPLKAGDDWLDSFWLGWALALAVLQFWHLVFPVNAAILLLFALFAARQLISQRSAAAQLIIQLRSESVYLLIMALLALWMSNRALAMPIAFDSGFRDIQAVMWIDSYPIVPGLGNLFSSLAFNHSVYLYDALLDVSIWSGRSHHIATGLLIMAYLARAVQSALQLWKCQCGAEVRWSSIFSVLTIPLILFYTVSWSGITHFLTDTVVDVVGFLCVTYLLDFVQGWKPGKVDSEFHIVRVVVLLVLGFTIKQTFIVFGLAVAATVIFLWFKRGGYRHDPVRAGWLAALTLIFAGTVLLPWMARGVITSGYIAFPQTVGKAAVDWAMPTEHLENRQRIMSTNTRIRGGDQDEVLGSWEWLGPWLQKFVRNIMPTMLPTAITLGALGLYAVGRFRNSGLNRDRSPGLLPLAPVLIMLVFWFFSFPEPKYVRYLFWGLAALSVILAYEAWPKVSWRFRITAVYGLTLLCLAYVAFLIAAQRTFPLSAGPVDGFHEHWRIHYDQFVTDSGLKLNVPKAGGPQCWRVPLPCTPHPNARLEERAPGELRHGFRIANSQRAGADDG